MSKEALMELIKQKDEMQKTIAKLTEQIQEIDKAKHLGEDIIDKEGFPRQDLDFGQLANYRNLKRKKAQLNNDHVKLMKQIESKLFQYHATLPKVQPEQQQAKPNFAKNKEEKKPSESNAMKEQPHQKIQQEKYVIDYLTPFAKISLVESNSPAELGGIKIHDLLSQFSTINIYTPDNIKQIPHHVKESQELRIVVMRPVDQETHLKYQKVFTLKDKKNYAKVQLTVVPQKWSGRGLLGCKIDPL